jgi:hypothetical protein
MLKFPRDLSRAERKSIRKWLLNLRQIRPINHLEANWEGLLWLRDVSIDWYEVYNNTPRSQRAYRQAIARKIDHLQRQQERFVDRIAKDPNSETR